MYFIATKTVMMHVLIAIEQLPKKDFPPVDLMFGDGKMVTGGRELLFQGFVYLCVQMFLPLKLLTGRFASISKLCLSL